MSYAARPQPTESNPCAIVGFVFSMVGFATCFVTSPLGVIFSFIGLRREQNQGLAIAGLIVGALGTVVWIGVAIYFLLVFFVFGMAVTAATVGARGAAQRGQTNITIAEAESDLQSGDKMLSEVEGNQLIDDMDYRDAWGKLLRYEVESADAFILRSAGPDGRFGSSDDVWESCQFGDPWDDFDDEWTNPPAELDDPAQPFPKDPAPNRFDEEPSGEADPDDSPPVESPPEPPSAEAPSIDISAAWVDL